MQYADVVAKIRSRLAEFGKDCRKIGICAILTGASLVAQPMIIRDPENHAGLPTFHTQSVLVLVPTTVVDRHGNFVTGLGRDAFTITDDGIAREIRAFSEDDAPVSVGIVFDLSGSMKGVLSQAKESLRALTAEANPDDETFLNAVSTRPRPFWGFTDEPGDSVNRIFAEGAGGSTALIDAIASSLVYLRKGRNERKALVIISDGMDNHSRYSREELMRLAIESYAQIYAIALCTAPACSKPVEMSSFRNGESLLSELASRTGGISYSVRGWQDLSRAAASIMRVLHNQYNIGFEPRDAHASGKWHRIKITVAGAGMRAYARRGYRLK
jgi:Ca-activated chloride channel family protein